nr:hypothetical protein [Tanacetum cinerariifolium]
MRFKGLSSWDLDKLTWEGRVEGGDVQEHAAEEVATDVVSPTPTLPSPSSPVISSSPPHQSPCPPQPQDAEGSSHLFQQGRISVDIDQDERIKLVVDHEKDVEVEGRHADKQAEIYNIDLDHSLKVLVSATSTPILAAKPKTLTITAASAVSIRRIKGVVIRDLEEELHTNTLAETAETPTVKDKGKGILIKAPKPMKKKDQVEMDAEYAKKLQEELDKEHEESYKNIDWNAALNHRRNGKEDEEIIKSINETPAQKAAKRRKISEEAQEADDLRRRLEIVQDKDDDVFVEAIPLAQKVPVVFYQIVVINNKPKYKIIRADDTHQFYISFTTLLKNFDKEDLETLWRIVKDRFSTSKPANFSDEYLLLTLKTMFGELDEQDPIWRNQKSVHGLALVKRWKLLTSCGVHVIILSTVQLFLLVERRRIPKIDFLHVFGCLIYIYNHKHYLVENIIIAESKRYPPNEYLYPYEPYQRYQTNSNDVSLIEPYERLKPVVLETEVSFYQNDQTDLNDHNDHYAQTDEIFNDDQSDHSNQNNDNPIIDNLTNTKDVYNPKPTSLLVEDTSVPNVVSTILSEIPTSIPSMSSPVPQDRWS